MARKKLKRFEDNEAFTHVYEPTREEVFKGYAMRGNWREKAFGNERPIVLELGCGKGEYTVALAKNDPDKNYIGVDIKGARLWYGATEVAEQQMPNAAFLRTQIDLLDYIFAENEVDEIWITFPDPQIKFRRAKHRLTNPKFLAIYRKVLKENGLMHLKTDSEFVYGFTQGVLQAQGHTIFEAFHDIDKQMQDRSHIVHQVKTHYEMLFREEGKTITYTKFRLDG